MNEWWKAHKNSLKKADGDLAPITYDITEGWDFLTTAILDKKATESVHLKNELKCM